MYILFKYPVEAKIFSEMKQASDTNMRYGNKK